MSPLVPRKLHDKYRLEKKEDPENLVPQPIIKSVAERNGFLLREKGVGFASVSASLLARQCVSHTMFSIPSSRERG